MMEKSPPNHDQAAIWNDVGGRAWTDLHAILDRLFQLLERLLVDVAVAAGGQNVLDVGCSAGRTMLAVASTLHIGVLAGDHGRLTAQLTASLEDRHA